MNNVNKSEGDNSDFFGVNRSVLSPLPKLGTMGSNWGEVRVTGFLYHLSKRSLIKEEIKNRLLCI